MTLFYSLLIVALTLIGSTPVSAAVNYPVIGSELRREIEAVRASKTFVGGEYTEIWENEYVAVSIPSHPQKGILFKVNYVDVTDPEQVGQGFKEPRLTAYNDPSISVQIEADRGYINYLNDEKELYGSCMFMDQKIYFFVWSTIDEYAGETWFMSLTWGLESEVFMPGKVIDRTNLGVLENEPARHGFNITGTTFQDSVFLIHAIYDSDAELNMEVSTDLTGWSPIDCNLETIPETYKYFEGARFVEVILTPSISSQQGIGAGSGSGIYFRIK